MDVHYYRDPDIVAKLFDYHQRLWNFSKHPRDKSCQQRFLWRQVFFDQEAGHLLLCDIMSGVIHFVLSFTLQPKKVDWFGDILSKCEETSTIDPLFALVELKQGIPTAISRPGEDPSNKDLEGWMSFVCSCQRRYQCKTSFSLEVSLSSTISRTSLGEGSSTCLL